MTAHIRTYEGLRMFPQHRYLCCVCHNANMSLDEVRQHPSGIFLCKKCTEDKIPGFLLKRIKDRKEDGAAE